MAFSAETHSPITDQSPSDSVKAVASPVPPPQTSSRSRRKSSAAPSLAISTASYNSAMGGEALSQRSMEPVVQSHVPVTTSLPSGALSVVAALFFVLLIALEFVGIFSLAAIFTLIAIALVCSVLLINYYRGACVSLGMLLHVSHKFHRV